MERTRRRWEERQRQMSEAQRSLADEELRRSVAGQVPSWEEIARQQAAAREMARQQYAQERWQSGLVSTAQFTTAYTSPAYAFIPATGTTFSVSMDGSGLKPLGAFYEEPDVWEDYNI